MSTSPLSSLPGAIDLVQSPLPAPVIPIDAAPALDAARRTRDAVAEAVRDGLTASPRTLAPWLFYDAEGSRLFERITLLPEYYLTRTERGILSGYAGSIIEQARSARTGRLRLTELGAGTATKTGLLLDAAVRAQGETAFLPIDVSATALQEACATIQRTLSGVVVQPQIANYVTDEVHLPPHDGPTLALYIGSSIGNFSPQEARGILCGLRAQLQPGDSLLLGTDLVKDEATLVAAYDDTNGVTAAFNLNMLRRINRELGANFDLAAFHHVACWNEVESRMEMHLRSTRSQVVRIAALPLEIAFREGETIHTENSYKFTAQSIDDLLASTGFTTATRWHDERNWFAVTLASAS